MRLLSSKLRVIESFCSRVETVCRDYNIDWSAGDEVPKDVFHELCNKSKAAHEIGTLFIKCKSTNYDTDPSIIFSYNTSTSLNFEQKFKT